LAAIKAKGYVGQAVLVLETGVVECWSVEVSFPQIERLRYVSSFSPARAAIS
jgi:hypothetical protein